MSGFSRFFFGAESKSLLWYGDLAETLQIQHNTYIYIYIRPNNITQEICKVNNKRQTNLHNGLELKLRFSLLRKWHYASISSDTRGFGSSANLELDGISWYIKCDFCLRRKNNIIYASNKSHHKVVLDVEFTLDWECFNISIKDRQRHGKRIYCASQFELFKITCRQMQHAIFPWIKTLI